MTRPIWKGSIGSALADVPVALYASSANPTLASPAGSLEVLYCVRSSAIPALVAGEACYLAPKAGGDLGFNLLRETLLQNERAAIVQTRGGLAALVGQRQTLLLVPLRFGPLREERTSVEKLRLGEAVIDCLGGERAIDHDQCLQDCWSFAAAPAPAAALPIAS